MKKKTQVTIEQPILKRETDESKIPENIRYEKNIRLLQFSNLRFALTEARANIVELGKKTEAIEQAERFDSDKLKQHWIEMQNTNDYINFLLSRIEEVQKLSNLANDNYNKALELTHPCFGCRNRTRDLSIGEICAYGWEKGIKSIPLSQVVDCPEAMAKEVVNG